MGIKRCPYCRALISEEDQYCRNCGTQLLFPEDENIEEEIPGDRLIDITEEKTSDENDFFPSAEDEVEEEEEELEAREGIKESWIELDEEENEEETEEVIIVDEDNLNQDERLEEMDDTNKAKDKKKEKTPAELLFKDDNTPLLFPEESLTDIINADSKEVMGERQVTEENITKKVERLKEEILAGDESRDGLDERRPGFVTMAVESLKNEIEGDLEEEEKSVLPEKKSPGPVTEIIQDMKKAEGRGKTEQSEEKSEDYERGVEKLKKEILAKDESRERQDEKRPGFVTMAVESLKNEIEGDLEEEEKSVLLEKKGPGLVTEIIQELKSTEGEENTEQFKEKSEQYEHGKEIPTFSTAELDNIGPTVDLGRRQVEDFFELLENKARESGERSSDEGEKIKSEETGEIPAWLKEAKIESFGQVSDDRRETEEETVFDEEVTGDEEEFEEKPVHQTIGFPESLTRDSADFESSVQETDEEFYQGEAIEDEREFEISNEEKQQPQFEPRAADSAGYQIEEKSIFSTLGFKNYVKAKMFDLLFIGLFWLVSIWLAARSLNSTIFRLLEVATSGLLIYLLILTVSYFFLFYFFIGETIGDRLFKEEDGEESDF